MAVDREEIDANRNDDDRHNYRNQDIYPTRHQQLLYRFISSVISTNQNNIIVVVVKRVSSRLNCAGACDGICSDRSDRACWGDINWLEEAAIREGCV